MRSGLLKRGWWLCVLFFAAVPVWGVQATLVGDAHVSALQPTVNSGSLSNLNVGGGYTSLVQFDFDVLPAGTSASQITRATLRVYLNRADVTGTVSVQSVAGSWNEGSVTYATMPPLGAVVQTGQAGIVGQFVTFDVTAQVQAWVSGATPNNGLALTATSAVLQFDSKENDQTAHAPQLEIALAAGGGGANGLPGATGTTGATGAIGPQGIQGVAGAVGATGATGAAGAASATGATGTTGTTGATGAIGPAGFVYQGAYSSTTNYALGDVVLWTGSSYVSLVASNHGQTPSLSPQSWGALTAQGPMGATGVTGATGVAGPIGALGPVGPPGEKGDQGAQGIAGQAGAQGIPGVSGATGLQGPIGPSGPAGPVGLSFQGPYNSTANYSLGDGVLWQGAGYVSLIYSNHGNTPDQSPAAWAMFTATGTEGATGATGATGVAGINGAVGATGATGTAGTNGATGATGSAGLVYQGTYNSTTAYALGDVVVFGGASYASLAASNHGQTPGLSPAWWGVLTSIGPAGPVGVIGPTGVAGATGSQGANGAQGPAGPTGLQGVAGQAGAQGIPGVAGVTGPQGPAGTTGAAGATGTAGATGSAGAVGMNFRGAWSTGTNYAINDAVTFGGSTYLAQSPGANFEPDLYTSNWTVIAQAGVTGPTGAAGTAAMVSVGTVSTLAAGSQATVTNSGTSQAAVLNFGIPQGIQGAAGTGGSGTSSGNFASVYHSVSFNTTFYSVNLPNASTNEAGTSGVLAWVPAGCTASQLSVYSQQSNTIVVTLRVGTPGSMANSVLSATVSPNSSFTATGSVTIAAGQFIDYEISSASGTSAGVWTALTCQ